jgi:hypothetical protein
MRFCSTHRRTLSASPPGGPPAVVIPPVDVGPPSGRGRCLVLAKSTGRKGPTSVHNRFVSNYSNRHIKRIYIYIYIN